jgi:exodeoxyribonuclease VII large subunit
LELVLKIMPQTQKLSEIVNEIDATIRNRFSGKTFWIKAEITDVKKQPDKKWCFLKFIEKDGNTITTEIKGVFWSNTYFYIQNFENETQQTFASGLEITCNVRVRFQKRFGIDLEVLEIDFAYAIGKLERERKQTLERLVIENATIKLFENGSYSTKNNRAELPVVFQTIALITAPNSDGQRDFNEVIENNKYGYVFSITSFLTTVQGDNASKLILQQLKLIESIKEKFDIVVIVRGGGSDIDFKSFNDYELSKYVAFFSVPILTGIGHDRNTSIVDLMARQLKTPTEVAAFILDNNYNFENDLILLRERLFQRAVELIDDAKDELRHYKQRIKNLNPTTILKKGFAIVYSNNKIVIDPKRIKTNSEMKTHLQNEIIISTVTKKSKNEK